MLTAARVSDILPAPKGQDGRCDMSLGIAFKGPEGIVLAADSRGNTNRSTPTA